MGTLIGQFPGRVLTPVALEITEHDFKGMQTYEPDTTVWGIGSKQLQEAVVNSFLVPPTHFMRSCHHFLLVGYSGLRRDWIHQHLSKMWNRDSPPGSTLAQPFHYPAFDHKIEGEGLGTFIMAKSRQKGCIQALEFWMFVKQRTCPSLFRTHSQIYLLVERVRNKSTVKKSSEFSPPALVMA